MKYSDILKVDAEKRLGTTTCSNLRPGKYCLEVVKIASKLVNFQGEAFQFKSEKVAVTCTRMPAL